MCHTIRNFSHVEREDYAYSWGLRSLWYGANDLCSLLERMSHPPPPPLHLSLLLFRHLPSATAAIIQHDSSEATYDRVWREGHIAFCSQVIMTVNLRLPEKRPTCSQLGSSRTLHPSVIQHTESYCLSNVCSQLVPHREKNALTPRDNFNDPTANSNYKNSKLVTKLYVKSNLESHLSLVIFF